jgi:mRNA interferase RelE/StbE
MAYEVRISKMAERMVSDIADRRIQGILLKRSFRLADEPEKQGDPLRDDLSGYRSVRAVGQRYRIVYRIDGDDTVVIVAAVGIRRAGDRHDIYEVARSLFRQALLD